MTVQYSINVKKLDLWLCTFYWTSNSFKCSFPIYKPLCLATIFNQSPSRGKRVKAVRVTPAVIRLWSDIIYCRNPGLHFSMAWSPQLYGSVFARNLFKILGVLVFRYCDCWSFHGGPRIYKRSTSGKLVLLEITIHILLYQNLQKFRFFQVLYLPQDPYTIN